jgi:voltage-gated potassium channel
MPETVRRRLFRQRKFRQLFIGLGLVSILLGIVIVPFERPTNPDFANLGDGFYWIVTTVTTVGYGDIVPITPIGRFISILAQLLGALMFGTIIAMIGLAIARYEDEFLWNRLFDRLSRLEEKIDKVQKRSEFIVRETQQQKSDTEV